MLNQFFKDLPVFAWQQAEDSEDLLRGVNIKDLHLHVSATVKIAAGASTGAVVVDSPATLIESIRIIWDGYDLVQRISGKDLLAITRRCVKQGIEPTTLADATAQTTAVSADLIIPFARPWLVDPYNTVLPALPVRQQLRVYVQWSAAVSSATSDLGTGAIVTGSDVAVTFTVAPTMVVTQQYNTSPAKPWAIPVISVNYAPQWSAANAALPYQLRGTLRYDSIMFRAMQGATAALQDSINKITFLAGNQRFWDQTTWDTLKRMERDRFPAVPAAEVGTLFAMQASGGKLSNAVNPNALRAAGSDPRYEFNVVAPTGNPGQIRVIEFDLLTRPGLTQLQG